jgi:hypothetical protein
LQNAKVRWEKSTQLIKSNKFERDKEGKWASISSKWWKRKTLNLTRSGTRWGKSTLTGARLDQWWNFAQFLNLG